MNKLTKNPLANKCRPIFWDDVAGQRTAVNKLRGMVELRDVPNAILLVGGTGTGKTTLAQMFASYINCKTFNRCGTCLSCKAPTRTNSDITEINASDARKIEDVRSLIKGFKFKPSISNLRIVIGNECQGYTPQAFQALLAPLEDMPSTSLMILTTTDPEKIPQALIGRCQVLNLSLVSVEDIQKRLKVIVKAEKCKNLNSKVLKAIAQASGGHVRQAIQMLDGLRYLAKGLGDDLSEKQAEKLILEQALKEGSVIDDRVAAKALLCLYLGKKGALCRTLLDAENYIALSTKMCSLNQYIIDMRVLKGSNHPTVWNTPHNKMFLKSVSSKAPGVDMGTLLKTNTKIALLKENLQKFAGNERSVAISCLT